jgi:hypothetical protein
MFCVPVSKEITMTQSATARRGLYGLDLERPPFLGLAPQEQAALLRSWGVNAVFGGYADPAFAEAAREAGIALFAEFACFAGAHWWEHLPECRPITATGEVLAPEEGYHGVNPSHPAVRQQRLEALEALLRVHPLDGVWLDFIRWPCHWEVPAPRLEQTSFDAATVRRFARDVEVALEAGSPAQNATLLRERHWEAWLAWRCEQIASWVAQARQVLDAARPEAALGLFAVPWRPGEHGDAIHRVIAQDHAALAQYVDLFSPMVYHAMCGQPVSWIAEVVTELAARTGRPVWPIIQAVDHPRPLPAGEYERALAAALGCPASSGALVFTIEGALAPDKLTATRRKFGGS